MKPTPSINLAVRRERAAILRIIRHWSDHCEQVATGSELEVQSMLTAVQILENVQDDIKLHVKATQHRKGGSGRK